MEKLTVSAWRKLKVKNDSACDFSLYKINKKQ